MAAPIDLTPHAEIEARRVRPSSGRPRGPATLVMVFALFGLGLASGAAAVGLYGEREGLYGISCLVGLAGLSLGCLSWTASQAWRLFRAVGAPVPSAEDGTWSLRLTPERVHRVTALQVSSCAAFCFGAIFSAAELVAGPLLVGGAALGGGLSLALASRPRRQPFSVTLERLPLPRSGPFTATLLSEHDLSSYDELRLTLRCCEEWHDLSAEHVYETFPTRRSFWRFTFTHKREQRWAASVDVKKAIAPTGRALSFRLELPTQEGRFAPPATRLRATEPAYWELEVSCGARRLFLLPIYDEAAPPKLDAPAAERLPVAGACPRCVVPLDDAGRCGRCDGELLPAGEVQAFAATRLGLDIAMLRELAAQFGGDAPPCPACRRRLSPVRVKGQPVELCLGCGSMWVDGGERAAMERAAALTTEA